MKKIMLTLMLVFSLGAFASEPTDVHFEEGNFFPITQQFDGKLLDDFTEKIFGYEGKELIIYFDTPGGSVLALSKMARIMKSSDIKFTCVASFAASAGFMLFQHCDNRLLLSDGILMSHNWSGGFQGEAPRILTMFYTIQSIVDTLEAVTLTKMSVTAEEYAALINKNLWMTLELATKYNAVDGVAGKVTCSKALIKQRNRLKARPSYYDRSPRTFYRSGCPLIQKAYTKSSSKNNDIYVDASLTLFQMAQKDYKMGNANWIYTGSKNLE